MHFKTNELWLKQKYLISANKINTFLNSHYQDTTDLKAILPTLKSKQELLTYLSKHVNVNSTPNINELTSDNFKIILDVGGKKTIFKVDTAAKYSTLMEVPNKLFQSKITSYSGAERDVNLGVLQTEHKLPLTAFVGLSENLLGLDYLINFSRINFNTSEDSISTVVNELYIDDANIFFDGDITILGETYINRNFCIDTGATQTFLMPKFYKKIRKLLLDVPIKRLSATESTGVMSTLGKFVKNIRFSSNDKIITEVNELPILFRNNTSAICDVILGTDILQDKINYIDFSKRRVSLSP